MESEIVARSLGLIAVVSHTLLITAVWFAVPRCCVSAIALDVTAVYTGSIFQMATGIIGLSARDELDKLPFKITG